MNAIENQAAEDFSQAAPLLDDAIDQLGPEDRTAILLRFFEQLEFRAVAEVLGSNEDAARMRVNRALDKLHKALSQKGVKLSAAALGAGLALEAAKAAPVGLAASIGTAALGGAFTGGTTLTATKIFLMSKIKIAIVSSVVAAMVAVPVVLSQKANKALREENAALRQQVAQNNSMQAQLAQGSGDAVKIHEPSPVSDSQTRELARLRNEVSRLRGLTNEMATMRENIHSLSQVASNQNHEGLSGTNDPLNVVGIIRNEDKRTKLCVANLVSLDSAKQQWALEQRKQPSDTPTINELLPYFGNTEGLYMPICPDGGTYTIGSVGEKPTCTDPKHVLH
jgi:hypothetical protein